MFIALVSGANPTIPSGRISENVQFAPLESKVVLRVVEYVVSPWFWDAGHLFVERRLDADLVWNLQAVSFAAGL